MTIRVRASDGSVAVFPDGTPEEEMARAMRQLDQEIDARASAGGGGVGSNIGAAVGRSPAATRRVDPSQRQAIGRRALSRQMERTALPFGVGHLTVPLRNMITDPANRRNVAESAQRFARDVQSIPSLNAGQVARETGAAISQGVRNLPQSAGALVASLPQLPRAMTYGPAEDEERATINREVARALGDEDQVDYWAAEGNRQTANLGLNVAAPALVLRSPSVLRAGATAAALDAPFALSRNAETESLQERLPGALTEIGGVGTFGATAQGVANLFGRSARGGESRVNRVRERAQQFQEAGVRPFAAALNGGGAGRVTMAVAENPFGGTARRNLRRSLEDVQSAASRQAGRYGPPASPLEAGEQVQAGVRRVRRGLGEGREMPMPPGYTDPMAVPTRDWTLPDKARALYDPIFETLDDDFRNMTGGAVEGPLLTIDATQRTIDNIIGTVSGTRSRNTLVSSRIRQIAEEISEDMADGSLSFSDMRRWRTAIREMAGDDALRQGVSRAELKRLESALTQDIYASADNIGGQAAQDLRLVDRWYGDTVRRIDEGLTRYYDARGGQTAFERMRADAGRGGNPRQLAELREFLTEDDWRTVAGTYIDRMGRPTSGRAHGEGVTFADDARFDLDAFVREFEAMTPEGRQAMFGNMDGLDRELANLSRVAGYMKDVRGFTNWSNSMGQGQALATTTMGAGALASAVGGNAIPMLGFITYALGTHLTGWMLTSPDLVRWLVGAPKAAASPRAARAHLRRFAELATRYPSLGPLLATELSDDPASRSPRPERMPAQTETPRR